MIDINQMQSMLEATVSTIKDMKENPGEHLEELFPTWKQMIVNTKEPNWKTSIWHKEIISVESRTISWTKSLHK